MLGGSRGLRAAVDRPIVIVVVLHRTRQSATLSRGAGAGHRVKHHLPHHTHTHRQITAPGAARRYAPADDSSTVLSFRRVRVRKFSRNKDLCQSIDPKIAADLAHL